MARVRMQDLRYAERKASEQADLYCMQVHDLRAGVKPSAIETIKIEETEEQYTFELFRPTAPHGGYIVQTFRYLGQSDSLSIGYLDDWRHLRGWTLEQQIALERLERERNRALDAELQSERAATAYAMKMSKVLD